MYDSSPKIPIHDKHVFKPYYSFVLDENGYGTIYGLDGEELDSWDPSVYSSMSEDPIKQEIEAL